MTDGIIQKVFSKYIQIHDCECPDAETNQWNELIRTKFLIIQQELIEKIKQKYPTCPLKHHGYYCSTHSIIDKLIGDNQE